MKWTWGMPTSFLQRYNLTFPFLENFDTTMNPLFLRRDILTIPLQQQLQLSYCYKNFSRKKHWYISAIRMPLNSHIRGHLLSPKNFLYKWRRWMENPTQHTTNNYGRITFNLERYPQNYTKWFWSSTRIQQKKHAHIHMA
jgi:hypothetical protein